jgi:hypothetical protein
VHEAHSASSSFSDKAFASTASTSFPAAVLCLHSIAACYVVSTTHHVGYDNHKWGLTYRHRWGRRGVPILQNPRLSCFIIFGLKLSNVEQWECTWWSGRGRP